MPTLMAMLKTVMNTAKITALMALKGFTGFFDSFFLSMRRHGIRMYVLETVKFKKDAANSMIETHVFAMKPLAIVVFMNFALYLYKSRCPKRMLPRSTLIRPTEIERYS